MVGVVVGLGSSMVLVAVAFVALMSMTRLRAVREPARPSAELAAAAREIQAQIDRARGL